MKHLFFFTALLASASIAATIDVTQGNPYAWSGCDTCQTPESTYFEPESRTLFVSNVAGDPSKKDGVGFIQRLDPSGKVTNAQWVTGLNAPKGMRAHNGTLWVSDINELIGIDIKTAKITSRVSIASAKLLNDVAVAPDGTVYVSDIFASRIHSFKDGKIAVFAEGDKLESPNGLLVVGKNLVVASWGRTTDWSTKTPGRLYTLDLKSTRRKNITAEPLGNLDGVEEDGKGNFLVSDFVAGKVYRVSPEGRAELLYTGFKGSADIGYIADQNLLIVPRMMENLITAFVLDKPQK